MTGDLRVRLLLKGEEIVVVRFRNELLVEYEALAFVLLAVFTRAQCVNVCGGRHQRPRV